MLKEFLKWYFAFLGVAVLFTPLLIIFHEFCHYIMALYFGCEIDKVVWFSFTENPRVEGHTDHRLGWKRSWLMTYAPLYINTIIFICLVLCVKFLKKEPIGFKGLCVFMFFGDGALVGLGG